MTGKEDKFVSLSWNDVIQKEVDWNALPTAPTFKPTVPAEREMPFWLITEVIEMMITANEENQSISSWELPYSPACPATTPMCFPQQPYQAICEGSLLRQMQVEELLFAFAYPVNENQRAAAARALGEKEWKWNRAGMCWYHEINVGDGFNLKCGE